MYSIRIRDHIMIAHSLQNFIFGPAQNVHGATYIVDVSFYSAELNEYNIVFDIGKAKEILHEILKELNYRNLDDLPQFKGKLTSTEFLAKYIHDKAKEKVTGAFEGKITVTLGESHIAWASYEED